MKALLAPLLALALLLPSTLAEQSGGPRETLRIHFLDVGQGDATLIEVPTGQWVLIDAGPVRGVVDALERLGVDTLDLLIASHNHADHIGGADAVLGAFPVRFFMDNGVPHTTATYRRMLEAVREADVPLLEPDRRTITLGDVLLEILPPPGDPEWEHNDNSIGVRLQFGAFAATFAGDAEPRLWAHWLETIPEILTPVQVHKASHHGSRNGDVPEAVDRLRPELVVVSAGAGNPYGHPHREAMGLYERAGALVLGTAQLGTIRIEARPDGSFTAFPERGGTGADDP